MSLLYHVNMYLEFLILACTIYILAPENIKGRKSGLRVSADALGRKAYCSCGYCLSRQYTHTATETKSATYRYKCRWLVDHAR